MAMLHEEFVITGRETRPVIRSQFPGPRAKLVVEEDHLYMATTTKTAPVTVRSAKGSVVLSADGDVFLDFASGVGVLNTGSSHPRIVQAIKDQAERFIHFAGTDFYYEEQAKLARSLTQVVPGAQKKKVFFANSGTEANEAALKLALWSQRRPRFLAFQRAFHGRTMGALSLTSSKPVHRTRYPGLVDVQHVPFPNPYRNVFGIDGYEDPDRLIDAALGYVEEVLETVSPADEVAGMFVEPVQGEGGYNFPPPGFYPKLHALLASHGILLISDEIQTGFGRTGKMFAMEHWGVKPDVTTMAKSMASGVPMGAAVFDDRLDFGVAGAHSNTFGGNALACAAAQATLQVLHDEKLPARAAQLGPLLGQRLKEIQSETNGIGDVRGLGLMWALEWVKDGPRRTPDKDARDRVVAESYKRGLIVLPCGKSSLRIIPPLTILEEQIQGGADVLREAVRAASK